MVWKLIRLSRNFPEDQDRFPCFWKLFTVSRENYRASRNFPEYPEYFKSVWQFFRVLRNFPGCPETFLKVWKLWNKFQTLVKLFCVPTQKLFVLQKLSIEHCLNAWKVFDSAVWVLFYIKSHSWGHHCTALLRSPNISLIVQWYYEEIALWIVTTICRSPRFEAFQQLD